MIVIHVSFLERMPDVERGMIAFRMTLLQFITDVRKARYDCISYDFGLIARVVGVLNIAHLELVVYFVSL